MPRTANALLDRLTNLLGPDAVGRRSAERRFFAQDALGSRAAASEAAVPLAVVRPATAEEVAGVLALASEAGVPVVAYGAGTGLMGGARSLRPGLVLDTVNLNQIDVHPADRLVWAGAGSILADVDSALRQHDLCLGHDPWTFPVASVGGPLSTNGLGYKGGRYGGMGDQTLALEVALADGTLLRTKALRRHSTGPDLARLFIGAEGTLGVITAAALRAYPIPERQELRAFRFRRFEDGFAAVDALTALGLRPSLLEYSEEHASPWPELSTREEEPPLLYLGFEGFAEEVEASLSRAERIAAGHGATPLPQQQVEDFWAERHIIAERFARNRGNRRRRNGWGDPGLVRDYIHVSLPPSKVLEFRDICHRQPSRQGAVLFECALWTGPDCFSAVLATPTADGGQERLQGVIDALLMSCQDLGGSMEYVHGAGLRLAHLMPREHAEGGFDLLQRLKRALDPEAILNPGKLGL
ncbi:MAG: FAD-binding protein [Dehalococcoidia bacterium]|nr:FAD-binding protein [Dehalococcoidia bacterium]